MKFVVDADGDGEIGVRDDYNISIGYILLGYVETSQGKTDIYRFYPSEETDFELEDLRAIADKMEELRNKL